jgi:hypothetical protein
MRIARVLLASGLGFLAACGGGNKDNVDRLAVAIASSPPYAASGGSLQFTIEVSNTGSERVRNAAMTIVLGAGLQVEQVSCAIPTRCPAVGADVTLVMIDPGTVLSMDVVARVPAGFRGDVDNTVKVDASGDTFESNDSAQFHVLVYAADVRVTGVAASEFFSGGTASYAMTLANSGPDAAPDVVLQHSLQGKQTLIGMQCAATGGATCPASLVSPVSIPSLPSGGTLNFTSTAAIPAEFIGPMGQTFQVSLAGDTNAANNQQALPALARIPVSPATPGFVVLESNTGDWVGGGKHYSYDRGNAIINVIESDSRVQVRVDGDQHWGAELVLPGNHALLQPGVYVDVPAQQLMLGDGQFNWGGDGRGCGSGSDTLLIVDAVTYTPAGLASLDLRFSQVCRNFTPGLHGQIHWVANESVQPPGPVNPPPNGLWAPAAGAVPATGNYVYLQADAGVQTEQGTTYTYTPLNAVLSLALTGADLTVRVDGDQRSSGVFGGMSSITTLQPGYYANLLWYPARNPARGGLFWNGPGGTCNVSGGWFVVDGISVVNGVLTAIDLRFEQRCERTEGVLHGKIHWTSSDTTQPPGPAPVPAGLWAPPAGATPATGNFAYLQGDAADFIGQGHTDLIAAPDGAVALQSVVGGLRLTLYGPRPYTGRIQAMSTVSQLQPGYYSVQQQGPYDNPTRSVLNWSTSNRSCNAFTGWFVVDAVAYQGSTLASIDLRFEQHCDGAAAAFHGQVHWSN